ncbi:MAG: tRNA dihydrouridine synthase DusB [Methylicorpusculum sp.]|uniref:tRNA dihydrouridine synthase DusB n=1 Tax=Methylicorpusculum sp. TaxID=2713644 RepID=UPI00271C122F|nr:tRNA dihydrouridine synthase DusB [Methylicorpusculum sp.]MDO8938903.1 tRNA dihydrouridine synthase DusB [Methylicorpusculum sp.]MDO9239985.1 tRNA dihydrouridine synthase DusB [Methylicorpusculum sp.]MDP2204660.1 tRNA dihydrouridine synthase DusB [Methylicorpusculum sp.]
MQIGPYTLDSPLILAPMAGVTDLPFRNLCKVLGAGLAVSEMVTSKPDLQKHKKTLLKSEQTGETGLRSVQILGTDPAHMAEAAKINVDRGAQIIDINMGCPAKKVCSVAAGSALMRDEALVSQILEAVVNAVSVPVTLKMRTGWDPQNRNALAIATIAETAGIAALTIHGRTRACKFSGHAEYETIRQIKEAVRIPVIANGDITCPQKAHEVLSYTGADALMIGRGAQGNPWIFKEIDHYLQTGSVLKRPDVLQLKNTVMEHLDQLYSFYGNLTGVRIARKHIGWYFGHLGSLPTSIADKINKAQQPPEQLASVNLAFTLFT